jgi:hypothetical protein
LKQRHLFYVLVGDDRRVVKADVLTWGRWFENAGINRWVGKDSVGDVDISTVCIGVEHRLFGKGPPLIFETMIFGGELDGHMWRYSTWDDAVTGHAMAVKKVKQHAEQH